MLAAALLIYSSKTRSLIASLGNRSQPSAIDLDPRGYECRGEPMGEDEDTDA
jgi:hypothetical protein